MGKLTGSSNCIYELNVFSGTQKKFLFNLAGNSKTRAKINWFRRFSRKKMLVDKNVLKKVFRHFKVPEIAAALFQIKLCYASSPEAILTSTMVSLVLASA